MTLSKYLPRTRRGRFRAVVALLLLTVIVCTFLALRTPGWYRPADPSDIAVIDAAGRMQLGGPARYHTIVQRAASGPQVLAYSQDELNAVLAITYANASGSYKGQVAGPMIYLSRGHLTVAARATNLPVVGSAVLSLTGHAELLPSDSADPATRCRIVLDSVHVGSLRIPQFLIRSRLEKSLAESLHSLTNTLTGVSAAMSEDGPARPRTISRQQTDAIVEQIKRNEPFAIPTRLERKTVYVHAITLSPGQLSATFAPTPLK